MTCRNGLPPRQPSGSAKGALLLVSVLVAGGLLVPVIPAPPARAESVWTSTSFADFNATGSWFLNTELNGTQNDTRIVLKSAPDWVQKNPSKSPPARAFAGMAALDTDDKTVLFGGTDFSGSDFADTWVYDLGDNRWTEMAPPESPPGREYCQLATVYGDDKVVLFGGFYYDQDWWPVTLNDTWVYDLSDNAWYNRTPEISPGPIAGCSMATVFGTDTVLLFGGTRDIYGSGMLRETWTYDVSENLWKLMSPYSSPSGRYGAGMAAVWGQDWAVLFGGYNDSTGTMGDTWIYDLSDDQWYLKSPANRPSARYFTALATRYDEDRVLLFGGFSDDTYIYDLGENKWNLQTPAHKPATRMAPGLATVARTDKTVVFGGEYSDIYQDTWAWDPQAYARSGEYRSPQVSTDGPAYFMTLDWKADTPAGTSVKFQVRTGDSEFNLSARNFTGPDGSTSSYYTGESAIWSAPGDRCVQYRALLSTSNGSATPALEEVNISFDLFPSTPVLLGPPDGLWLNTTSPVFSWRFNDTDTAAQGMFDWQLDRTEDFSLPDHRSGEVGSAETDYTYDRPLAEGLWNWRVRTADAHGWGPYSEVRSVGVDITAPSAFTPFVNPAKWTAGPVDLIFLSDDNVSGIRNFTVSIDNQPLGECQSPWSLPELPDGVRNIVVRATDHAGNWAEGRTRAYIDRTPPADFSAEADPPTWTRTMPQITFNTKDNASGVDHYEVRLDHGQFLVRTSPFVPPELDDGEHVITVRAFDRAGNLAESSVTIYIDRSKPDPMGVDVSPRGWTALDQTVTFWTQDSTTDIDRYELRVDGGPFSAASSPFLLSGLGDGEHTVTVRAYDRGGNFIEGEARAFTDRTPPEEFTAAAEPAGWTGKTPVLTFVAYDNCSPVLTYKASVDNATFSKVKSPWSLSGLPDGAHEIVFQATDEAGNTALANVTVLIDTSPPRKVVLAINNGSASTRSRKATLSISADDPGSGPGRMCFSDDGLSFTQWEPFAPQREWTLRPGSGDKTVYVKVQDALGNEARPSSATIEYSEPAKVDTTTPIVIGAVVAIAAAAGAGYAVLRLRKPEAPAGGEKGKTGQ